MTYEIWDTRSGNLLAHFERYGAALDFMRDQIEGLGISWVDGVAFFEITDHGRSRDLVAENGALLPLLRIPVRTSA